MPTCFQLMCGMAALCKSSDPEIGFLMNGKGTVAARFACDQLKGTLCLLGSCPEGAICITRHDSDFIRLNPDLEKMNLFGGGVIELAVPDTRSCRHVLDFAGTDDASVAHEILMLQLSAQDIGDDFHVPMGMGSEAHARCHAVVIDHPETAKSHPFGIVVFAKAERVP
jgi:hypothetical protein